MIPEARANIARALLDNADKRERAAMSSLRRVRLVKSKCL